jgi:ubiquitin C-terminal hydrolase
MDIETPITMGSSKSKVKGMIGLINLGNTCYMNSILQCLINTPNLYNKLSSNSIKDDLHKNILKKIETINKKNILIFIENLKKIIVLDNLELYNIDTNLSEQDILNKLSNINNNTIRENIIIYIKNRIDINNISIILENIVNTISYKFLELLNDAWSSDKSYINPNNFRKIFIKEICKYQQNFSMNEEQDSPEALDCILDCISDELRKEVNINYNFIDSSYNNIFTKMDNLSEINCYKLELVHKNIYELYIVKKTLDEYYKKNYSIIVDLFQSLELSTLECSKCNFKSYSAAPKYKFEIEIPQKINYDIVNQKLSKLTNTSEKDKYIIKKHIMNYQKKNQEYNLYDCLEEYFKTELLEDENKWYCLNCQHKVKAYKKLNIWIPPDILIIQIKRFEYKMDGSINKLTNLINFPIYDLHINKFMSEYSSKIDTYKYDLYAISNQIGDYNGGHYYSYVKSLEDNNWYNIDDTNIYKLEENELITKNAYILFYRLKK